MTLSGPLRSLVQPAALLRPSSRIPYDATVTSHMEREGSSRWVTLGGAAVKLLDTDEALAAITARAERGGPSPLGVVSANLDHIKHFGAGGRWADTLTGEPSIEWLTLLDGAPLVTQAERITNRKWPRLAGSDLILPLLTAAENAGLRVGFLGGTPEVQDLVREKLSCTHPRLCVSGWWAPERSVLSDPDASHALAEDIRNRAPDILVVCLGKPRQELWIAEHGRSTGAKVLLAFGAAIDFLAGRVQRAPAPIRNAGAEWAWRLALEPSRLATRYLVDGPEAYLRLRRSSGPFLTESVSRPTGRTSPGELGGPPPAAGSEVFSPVAETTDVAVLIVTYNSAGDILALLQGLRREVRDQTIKVVVADNSPGPDTMQALANQPDVFSFSTGGNLGYAGAINSAMAQAGSAGSYLVLNPDMRVVPGAVKSLRCKMAATGAGVVVPLLIDDDGSVYPSLRREPSLTRAFGDALLGSRFRGRPEWLSEMDFDDESYRYAHAVDWATGAALLIRADTAALVGDWDEEYFLYSEETDFLRRVRAAGEKVWFEPRARMTHCRGGSGSSPALDALLAANRIRYIRKFHAAGYARAFRAAVVLSAALRSPLPSRGSTLSAVLREKRWAELPHAVPYAASPEPPATPWGSVIIPAHNEASVIGRTLTALSGPLGRGDVEVIVACNGCTDNTAEVARSYAGVRVIELTEASKVAALNAADGEATQWPRVYLDADIELPEESLRATLDRLHRDHSVLCARPAFRYETQGADWLVRSYYRARTRLPQATGSIWGAGIYALSQRGHDRLGKFPAVTADDCYVDRLYDGREKVALECLPVTVRTPRSAAALLRTLRRVYRGNAELVGMAGSRTGQTLVQLMRTVTGPVSAFDALVYAGFAIAGRHSSRSGDRWERDESSRQ